MCLFLSLSTLTVHLGIIQSFSALAAILATFFIAKVTDKGNGNRLMKINTLIQSGVWITKGY